ncbi:hypothetical protein HYU23_01860 [Candidatus Woesearchaeota archaeon]|nr:hypothetical protein [Candidatus Woesearchaeota archaeon]
MIKKEEVLEYLKNLNFDNDFYIKVLEYFIQELGKILKKPIKKDIENLRLFQFEFEKVLTPEDNSPENYLDKQILDLFFTWIQN